MFTINDIIETADVFKGSYINQIKYELLEGGFVNKTYKTECGGKIYCVRINNSRQIPFFGLDAAKEAEACRQASLFSIAPAVYMYNSDNAAEYLITEYFPGRCLSNDDVRNPEIMKKYVRAIKLIHDNIKVDRVFSIYDQFDKYIEAAAISNTKLPSGLGKVMAEVERIKKMRADSKILYKVFAHNDIWQNNILYDGNKVSVIDWEYCGYGDGFFDFAHIANCGGMTFEEEKFMLNTYFEYFEMDMWEILRQMKYISSVYCVLWYVFHACIVDDEKTKDYYIKTGNDGINNLADSINNIKTE
jgi:thiamine kinase-like enzyme